MDFMLSDDEKRILLRTARLSIERNLGRPAAPWPEATERLSERCGAFVSLHVNNNLRGCIGLIAAQKPLLETVREMALSAAFSDPRFQPIAAGELAGIEIEISVLSPFRKITDVKEITVGTHGLMVRRGFQSGLLLPQVATEYAWNREQFLAHTCQKAGLPPSAWRTGELEMEIFTAVVFSEHELGLA